MLVADNFQPCGQPGGCPPDRPRCATVAQTAVARRRRPQAADCSGRSGTQPAGWKGHATYRLEVVRWQRGWTRLRGRSCGKWATATDNAPRHGDVARRRRAAHANMGTADGRPARGRAQRAGRRRPNPYGACARSATARPRTDHAGRPHVLGSARALQRRRGCGRGWITSPRPATAAAAPRRKTPARPKAPRSQRQARRPNRSRRSLMTPASSSPPRRPSPRTSKRRTPRRRLHKRRWSRLPPQTSRH